MEFIKDFLINNWFYLYGIIYILDLIYTIIKRIIDKEIDIEINIQDYGKSSVDKLIQQNKKIYFKFSYLISVLSFAWIIIALNNDYIEGLEKIYFVILLIAGFALPLVMGLILSADIYSEAKKEGKTTLNADDIKNKPRVRKERLLYTFLNLFESVIIYLILNNHFNF